MQQPQINRKPLLLHQLPPQHLRITPRITRNITRLLHIRQRNNLHPGALLKYRLETMQRSVDGAAERRGRHQADPVVEGEGFAEGAALFVAEVG